MDVKKFRLSVAGLVGQLFALDPATGLPTTTPINGLAHLPQSLSETKLPCSVIFTNSSKYPTPPPVTIDRFYPEASDFILEFYITKAQAGVDFVAEERAEMYLDYTRDWLQSHPQLWDGDPAHAPVGIQKAYTVSRTGITSRLAYTIGEEKYLGFSYVIRVEADNEVNYYGQ